MPKISANIFAPNTFSVKISPDDQKEMTEFDCER